MKSFLKYIGVVDKMGRLHHVEFSTGLNVITGKSSTGKSAMIEIFDYCFGSSEFTVPAGVITENAQLYFIALNIKETNIVLARTPTKPTKAFLKEETILPTVDNFSMEYFEDGSFISLENFKIVIGRYLGLEIVDTDEDLQDREYAQKKKGRPSVRNMTPFMLQHQNLIANKHSIFYRFDEKEKREQTIEQFKIFVSFVTQEYFTSKQKLADEERNLRILENKQKYNNEQIKGAGKKLEDLLKEFTAITGKALFSNKAEEILMSPANYLNRIYIKKIESDYESNEATKQLQKLKEQKNILYAQRRSLQIKLDEVNSSVTYANSYREHLNDLPEIDHAKIHISECPFCKTTNEGIINEANLLSNAIAWLNTELAKSTYLIDSFEADKKNVEEEIKLINFAIASINNEIAKIEKITHNLKSNRDLEEQGLKVKLKIENLLESITGQDYFKLEESILKSKNEIQNLNKLLRDKFNVSLKLKEAKTFIDNAMNKIGGAFDFEDSYRPINLKFSLDSFEFWYENSDNEKIYLRSMGSGANWLYSHLTLFMALHKYLCSLGDQALIPPILFLDQPSQVYFPTAIKDVAENFDAKKLKEKEGLQEKTDEDLTAVETMFNQIVKFCSDTFKETGIEPQIIITDHADNLKLEDVEFESLVNNRRWRKRGFITL